jgi:hypothetical protein
MIKEEIVVNWAPIKYFKITCDKCGKNKEIQDGLGKSLKVLLRKYKWCIIKKKVFCDNCIKSYDHI